MRRFRDERNERRRRDIDKSNNWLHVLDFFIDLILLFPRVIYWLIRLCSRAMRHLLDSIT
ncbi:hypothetical protein ABRT01_05425 [Lentibacillus sp. L22]|uniref:hypothetical protein n=1 Tax=Lentibacillus TaxID=175304 RepID=UPI0022B13E60|nr:hypothetical protein [Lentibacillus daqui]